ncbi:hypothetical protein [Brevundimonas sp.]|uniref:hypothetical protein n=1 Tax=Brevundimonas sp. TaxID=1871086 RepID=UPI00289E53DA|nr:hypothetical protein [Brevundimonas sp.]
MSQSHNIAGSEAFGARRPVQIRELPRRKPRSSTVAGWYASAVLIGGGVSLVDVVIGAPVCLGAVLIIFAVLWLRA